MAGAVGKIQIVAIGISYLSGTKQRRMLLPCLAGERLVINHGSIFKCESIGHSVVLHVGAICGIVHYRRGSIDLQAMLSAVTFGDDVSAAYLFYISKIQTKPVTWEVAISIECN